MENRLIELETKVAFQDETIDKLNAVIIEQQKQIDSIIAQLRQLRSQFENEMDDMPTDEKPPHY